jgi:imidazolonepropionase
VGHQEKVSPRTKKSTIGHAGQRQVPAGAPLLLVNIKQLLTLEDSSIKAGPRRGRDLEQLGIIENGAVLCWGGKTVAVGTTGDALRDRWIKVHKREIREIDCEGKVVLPGFVDSHTHPVFAGPRLVDFEKRIAGASYQEIAEAGGGIRASIDGVRLTPKTVLAEKCVTAFNQMLAQGTTTVEAKSGYGLSYEAEIKSLEVIRDAARQWPGTVLPTLLGAHVVPPEFAGNRNEYVRMVREELIPQVARKGLASFVDVFCDKGAFTAEEAGAILQAGVAHGLGVRAHVCQLTAAPLGQFAKLNPASLDHLDHVTDQDVADLARQDTVATLLPGANYFLGLTEYPPARKLIEAGVPVALATDYNPGSSPTPSMPFIMSLACTQMRMSPAEAIVAATINGAWALKVADRKGSIAPGKGADLAIFDVRDYREIPYWFAAEKCARVVVGGKASIFHSEA